jgi:hypothetical protein
MRTLWLLVVTLLLAEAPVAQVTRYSGHGLTLEHDSSLTREETFKEGHLTVTLKSGSDFMIIVDAAEVLIFSGKDYATTLAQGMHDGYEAADAKVTDLKDFEREVAGKDCEGKTFDFELMGAKNRYASCGIKKAGHIVSVILQYTPSMEAQWAKIYEPILKSIAYEN